MSVFLSNEPLWLSEPIVLREACFLQLDQAFTRPLVCVTADIGYGKTTLVASYVRERRLPTIWFALGGGRHSYADFLKCLGEALASLLGKPLGGGEIDILEAIAGWKEPLTVVLDCGSVTAPDAQLLEYVLQLAAHGPRNVTFTVLSRIRLPFPYARLKLQNSLSEWKQEQLILTLQEISGFFEMSGIDLDEEELRAVHLQTGGWAMCLPYLQQAWNGLPRPGRRWTPHLLGELLHELLTVTERGDPDQGVAPEELDLLSVLHELKTEVLEAYLEDGSPKRLMDSLSQGRFFLQRNDDYTYRFIPAVRDFLYRRLVADKGESYAYGLHLKAARIYEEQFQYYYAFAHCVATGSYVEAARLMQVIMNFYTPERFLHLLDGSLETICPSISISTFSMFLFRCVPMTVLRGYVAELEGATSRQDTGERTISLIYLQHRLALILFYSGDVARAKALVTQALEGSELLGHQELIIINLSLLAQCCRFLGELEEGVRYARRALTGIELHGHYAAQMHTVWILTELLLERGEVTQAQPIVAELLKLAGQYDDEAARTYALLARAKLARLKGELDEALLWAEKGYHAAEAYRIDPDLGWACLELGLVYRSRSEPEQAVRYLTRSAAFFEHYAHFHALVLQLIEAVQGSGKEGRVSGGSTGVVPETAQMRLTQQEPGADRQAEREKRIEAQAVTADETKSGRLSIELLGPLHIRLSGRPLSVQRKSSLRLLLLLASHYGQKLPKDRLLEELFPEADYTSQSNRFYVALSTLRKALEPTLRSGRKSSYILQTGELYYLDETSCSLDLAAFEESASGRGEPNAPEERIQMLERTTALYKGDLLEEYPYEPFLEPIRERVKRTYLQLLRELGMLYWERNDYRRGMACFERILERDSWDETAYWDYIRLLMSGGLVSNARQIAARMIEQVEHRLGIPVKLRLMQAFPDLL